MKALQKQCGVWSADRMGVCLSVCLAASPLAQPRRWARSRHTVGLHQTGAAGTSLPGAHEEVRGSSSSSGAGGLSLPFAGNSPGTGGRGGGGSVCRHRPRVSSEGPGKGS